MPILRVSVLRCHPQHFAELKKMMAESMGALEHGIRQMRGLIHFYAGEDEAVNSLTNVSVWRTLEDAKQLDTFQPMLDLGKVFVSKGASFERPIMNYASLWEIAPERLPPDLAWGVMIDTWCFLIVMAGLAPAIHVFDCILKDGRWIPGLRPRL